MTNCTNSVVRTILQDELFLFCVV